MENLPYGTPLFRADIRPSTFDAEALTVEVVFTTGAAVTRKDTRGLYSEILSVTPEHLKLDRLIGASVLNGHRQSDLRDVIGVVETAWIADGKGYARLRLSSRQDVAPILADVQGGIILHISIGYHVSRWLSGTDANGARTLTAVDWAPFEVSFVPVPADPGATVRSNPPMADNTIESDHEQIRSLVNLADLEPSFAEAQITAGATIEVAREAVRSELRSRSQATPPIRAIANQEAPESRLRGMEDALYARMSGTAPTEAARPFAGASLRDIAEETLSLRGMTTRGMNPDAVFRAAHTTSDFPVITGGAGQRVLMDSYAAAQSPLKTVSRQGTRTDFRAGSNIRIGEMGELSKVTESGEITSTSRAEAAESYAIETFGRLFNLSRKAKINDDLGAFADFARAAGQAAAQTEASVLFNLLTASSGVGPTMAEDGKKLFHADHGNLASVGSALDEASLSAARLAMRTQKGLDGKTVIAATPKYLVVGPELETTAEKLLSAIIPVSTGDVNPFAGKLTLLVEPRLTGKSWYVFADPAQLPVLEYAYLASAPGPQMSQREGWDILSTEFRAVLDFGAGALDFRGAYRNAGA